MIVLALAAFVGVYVFNILFPLIIVAVGIIGYLGYQWEPEVFVVVTGHSDGDTIISDVPDQVCKPSR